MLKEKTWLPLLASGLHFSVVTTDTLFIINRLFYDTNNLCTGKHWTIYKWRDHPRGSWFSTNYFIIIQCDRYIHFNWFMIVKIYVPSLQIFRYLTYTVCYTKKENEKIIKLYQSLNLLQVISQQPLWCINPDCHHVD
jgi:hypothetical protein